MAVRKIEEEIKVLNTILANCLYLKYVAIKIMFNSIERFRS